MSEYLDKNGLTYFWSKIKIKHDTTANWDSAINFIPNKGEVIIYEDYMRDDDVNLPNIKIGDGSTYVPDLPFLSAIPKELADHINNHLVHVSSEDRTYWNHKIDCEDTVSGEELILFR